MDEFSNCVGFEWDEGNSEKNWIRHHVTIPECEQVFFNQPLVLAGSERLSVSESRFYALGQTYTGRRLFIVFVIRSELVRVVSARDMSRRERRVYDHANEEADTEI